MTNRGNLAYYLAAWVCGCFFMAVGFWIEVRLFPNLASPASFRDVSLLGFGFFGLIFGAVPSLLFGWILRLSLKLFTTARVWLWVLAGAVLAVLLIWCLGGFGQLLRNPRYLPYSALPIWPFLVVGPLAVLEAGLWMAAPVGGATGAVLFAVHDAFKQNPQGEA